VRARAHVQVHVRLGQAQVGEEHAGHPRVVMLARVNERLVDTRLAERTDDRRGLHEVRPGAKHVGNQSLHRCPYRNSTRGTNLTNRSGRGRPVRAYRPWPEPRARLTLLECSVQLRMEREPNRSPF